MNCHYHYFLLLCTVFVSTFPLPVRTFGSPAGHSVYGSAMCSVFVFVFCIVSVLLCSSPCPSPDLTDDPNCFLLFPVVFSLLLAFLVHCSMYLSSVFVMFPCQFFFLALSRLQLVFVPCPVFFCTTSLSVPFVCFCLPDFCYLGFSLFVSKSDLCLTPALGMWVLSP